MAIDTTQEMNHAADPRQTFTGKRLTESQHYESWAIADILQREIHKSGSFRDKLTDYSVALSRTDKFDVSRAESIIRDQYKARYGESMNQTRKVLMQNESELTAADRKTALNVAQEIGTLIQDGETMPFYKAYDVSAVALSESLEITEAQAKKMMKEEFEADTGQDLYSHYKGVEDQFHGPVRDAERQARDSVRDDGDGPARPRPR